MTEFRILNGDVATCYVASAEARLAAANLAELDLAETADRQQVIRRQIAELSRQHRQLDEQVNLLTAKPKAQGDDLSLRRLKKKKLLLKDRITVLKMQLVPDIPA